MKREWDLGQSAVRRLQERDEEYERGKERKEAEAKALRENREGVLRPSPSRRTSAARDGA